MGQLIGSLLEERGHQLSLIVDPQLPHSEQLNAPGGAAVRQAPALNPELLSKSDVAIEFSLAEAVVANVQTYAAAGVPAVIGTTGWADDLEEIRQIVRDSSIGLLYGANFSIGANLFFRAAAAAAALAAPFEEYDCMIHEMHHSGKKDSPSGTALTLAQQVLEKLPGKDRIETGRLDRQPERNELHVSSTRGGSVPGTHTLYLDSAADTIEVRHTARSRAGFALGAIRGAEWIESRSGVYTVDAFIDELVKEKE
jgi:4-hydroxy-tetrahydrodipicolinate reductase